MKLYFDKPLLKALVKERINRFIFIVELDGELVEAHCPCDDKSGREHDVSETAFADKFNEHFVHMLDTFDDVCNFKVKSIKKL